MKTIRFQIKIKYVMTSIFLMTPTFHLPAQIPNDDFEAWADMGSYEDPNAWGTPDSQCTGSLHPVMKSTDHYPVSVGLYSLRLQNNLTPSPTTSYCGLGVAGLSKFPVSGHTHSLTGYYKFLPLNGNTMLSENKKSLDLSIFANPSSGHIILSNRNPTGRQFKLSIPNSLRHIVYANDYIESNASVIMDIELDDGIFFF